MMRTERKDEDGEGLNPSNLMMTFLDVYVVQSGEGLNPFTPIDSQCEAMKRVAMGLNPYT